MRSPLIRLFPALLALSLGFTSCNEKTESSAPTSSDATEAGKVAFRVSAADLALLGVGIDSVRIDAVREGFASRSALGSLSQTTLLEGLQSGPWTLKVALFDATQAIHWYGEAVVQVVPGKSVDAEVHLRKATGSVRVRIILDDKSVPDVPQLPPIYTTDTVVVSPVPMRQPSDWMDLPLDGATRTVRGVFLQTKYDCNVKPVVFQDTVVVSGKRAIALYLVRSGMSTMIGCETRRHTVFIPVSPTVDVVVKGLVSDSSIRLPAPSAVAPVADSTFKQYESIQYLYSPGLRISLLMTADGMVARQISKLPESLDTLPAPEWVRVSGDSLRVIRLLLGQATVRHPASPYVCPDSVVSNLENGPPTIHSRYVTYSDGLVSSQKLDVSKSCDFPVSWSSLERVDEILRRLFIWN